MPGNEQIEMDKMPLSLYSDGLKSWNFPSVADFYLAQCHDRLSILLAGNLVLAPVRCRTVLDVPGTHYKPETRVPGVAQNQQVNVVKVCSCNF